LQNKDLFEIYQKKTHFSNAVESDKKSKVILVS